MAKGGHFFVLNDQSYYYCDNGQDQDQHFIIAHQHHPLFITRMKEVSLYFCKLNLLVHRSHILIRKAGVDAFQLIKEAGELLCHDPDVAVIACNKTRFVILKSIGNDLSFEAQCLFNDPLGTGDEELILLLFRRREPQFIKLLPAPGKLFLSHVVALAQDNFGACLFVTGGHINDQDTVDIICEFYGCYEFADRRRRTIKDQLSEATASCVLLEGSMELR